MLIMDFLTCYKKVFFRLEQKRYRCAKILTIRQISRRKKVGISFLLFMLLSSNYNTYVEQEKLNLVVTRNIKKVLHCIYSFFVLVIIIIPVHKKSAKNLLTLSVQFQYLYFKRNRVHKYIITIDYIDIYNHNSRTPGTNLWPWFLIFFGEAAKVKVKTASPSPHA